MFHVGQKIVCIDDTFIGAAPIEKFDWPNKGGVYTVRWCGSRETDYGDTGVMLFELFGGINPTNQEEYAYAARRFRPVKETDISIFTAMLNPAPNKQKERA